LRAARQMLCRTADNGRCARPAPRGESPVRKMICAVLTAAALGTAGCGSAATAAHTTAPAPSAGALHLAAPAAMANPPAGWRSRPPRRVTPGAERHDPLAAICPLVSGPLQAGPVRSAVKNAVFTEYRITRPLRHRYRIDHLIPRELDGSNAISNLWPQLARGFHAKNRAESALHAHVCGGQLTLVRAQRLIRKNWVLAYRRYAALRPKPRKPAVTPTPSAPPSSAAPPTAAPPPPPPSAPPSPACQPLSSSGNCYEPGEFCSDADHGLSGVAGNGEAITCEDNDGWRWEPTG
jgi:hypothetical protein